MKLQHGTGGFLNMSLRNTLGDNPKLAELLAQVQTTAPSNSPVINRVVDNLTETYMLRYGKPTDDMAAIQRLGEAFYDLMGHCTTDILDGIGEYYRLLLNRDLPAYEWLLEAFHVAGKKDDNKKNFPYVIGMVRCWMKFGFGHIPAQEEEEVVEYFKEVTRMSVNIDTRILLQNLIGTYGVVKVTRMIGSLTANNNLTLLMAYALKGNLEEKFPDMRPKHTV